MVVVVVHTMQGARGAGLAEVGVVAGKQISGLDHGERMRTAASEVDILNWCGRRSSKGVPVGTRGKAKPAPRALTQTTHRSQNSTIQTPLCQSSARLWS